MTVRKSLRIFAAFLLCGIFLLAIAAELVTPYSYARQFRELPNAAPSELHPLGTDGLGRDLFSRLLYATRVSLLLAPAAALLSTLIAGALGGAAGFLGGWWERAILAIADLSMASPLLFVLIALRAMLPLDLAPLLSVIATFLILGLLGWPSSLRVICAATQITRREDGQPSNPRIRNVAITERSGARSKGNMARRAINTKSNGEAIDKSAMARIARSHQPPRNPAAPPRAPAIRVESKAAAGARSSETLVP